MVAETCSSRSTTLSYVAGRPLTDYLIRDIDKKLWKQFKERAAKEGRSLRWVLLEFIKSYVTHGLPKDPPHNSN
jgi:hypothetical protein